MVVVGFMKHASTNLVRTVATATLTTGDITVKSVSSQTQHYELYKFLLNFGHFWPEANL